MATPKSSTFAVVVADTFGIGCSSLRTVMATRTARVSPVHLGSVLTLQQSPALPRVARSRNLRLSAATHGRQLGLRLLYSGVEWSGNLFHGGPGPLPVLVGGPQ